MCIRDRYLELRAKKSAGELLSERTFAQAAERFKKEYEVMTEGERNEVHVKSHYARLRNWTCHVLVPPQVLV